MARPKGASSGTVSVNPAKTASGPRYVVRYSDADGPHRLYRRTKKEAEGERRDIIQHKDASGEAWLSLTRTDRARLMQFHREAVQDGYDPWTLLQDARSTGRPRDIGPSLQDVTAALLAAKKDDCSPRYLANLRQMLEAFAAGREAMPIGNITHTHLEEWLTGVGQGSRSTWRARLATFLNFARRRGYITANPLDRVELSRNNKNGRRPAIFTVDETRQLLDYLSANPHGLAWFALTTLAGLRPEEAMSTKWAQLRSDHVVVDAQTSKKRQRRIVYPHKTALLWLAKARRLKSTLPFSMWGKNRIQAKLREAIGWNVWKQDVTRHSAASYWLAECGDVQHVARMLGNSPRVLEQHYLELVTREDAKAFWALVP